MAKTIIPKSKCAVKSGFNVLPSTMAICLIIAGDDHSAGIFLFGLLEMWVHTKERIVVDGKECLVLTSAEWQEKCGLSPAQLNKRALPILKKSPFLAFPPVTHHGVRKIAVHLDTDNLWTEICAMLGDGITSPVKNPKYGPGYINEVVDRKKLPYLFKQLFDTVSKGK